LRAQAHSYEKKVFLFYFEHHSKVKTMYSLLLKGYSAQEAQHAIGAFHLFLEVALGDNEELEDEEQGRAVSENLKSPIDPK
jgi:hypothetical protein